MLSYRIIKMTDTLSFENISELVRNELRRSYLRLCVQVEENIIRNFLRNLSKIIDKLNLKVYNNVKETNLRGGARYKNQLQEAMDIAD